MSFELYGGMFWSLVPWMSNTGAMEDLTASFGEAESKFNPYFNRTYRKPTSSAGQKNVLPSHGPKMERLAETRVRDLPESFER
jgi:hypothetical protein